MKVLQLLFVVSLGFNCLQASQDAEDFRARNNYSPASLELEKDLVDGRAIIHYIFQGNFKKAADDMVKEGIVVYYASKPATTNPETAEQSYEILPGGFLGLKYSKVYKYDNAQGVQHLRDLADAPNQEAVNQLTAAYVARVKQEKMNKSA